MPTSTLYDPQVSALSVNRDNGKTLNLYFEPVYSSAKAKDAAGVFIIYKSEKNGDNIFNHLSIPGEIGDNIPGLDIVNKKDCLGELVLLNEKDWQYNGDALTAGEQEQVANYMRTALYN